MEEILIKAAQLITSLSILIVLHELGHFLPARFFGTKIEKFYLFFDPWFSLFKYKKGDTEWGIGWIPLGGYVKISGMIDESMDKEAMKLPPKDYEFRAKPAWQRLIIMIGGVTVNLILGVLLYAMTLFVWGEQYLPLENMTNGLWVRDSLMIEMGLQSGDKIVSIGDVVPEKFNDLLSEILLTEGDIIIEREGEKKTINIPVDIIGQLTERKGKGGLLYPRVPVVIGEISEKSQNINSGLAEKDIVKSIDGTVIWADNFSDYIKNHKSQNIKVLVQRGQEEKTIALAVNDTGALGLSYGFVTFNDFAKTGIYAVKTLEFGLLESLPAGAAKAYGKMEFYVRQFGKFFKPKTGAVKALGGFGAIGSLFPPEWNWQIFWEITAFLSLILAFMNLLPIPALDGGHVMFLLYEIIIRREPNEKFMEYAQITGMVLLLTLMVYANGNDVLRALQ